MGNDCCRPAPPVAVPCVYDFGFIAKAMIERTTISIDGISGTVEGVSKTAGGLIRINFTNGSFTIVNAR